MIIRKILAPIDFSERSREELRWATTMARNFGAELIALHVIPAEVVELSLTVPALGIEDLAARKLE